MNIRGYLPTSLIEWPGKISAVIFVGGCNLRCPFCHNRDLVLHPEKLSKIPEEEIFKDLKKRKKWVDGLVITGGEPTLQPGLPGFLGRIKKLGFLTMIETNGTRPRIMAQLLNSQMVDRLSMDIKTHLDGQAYSRASGVKIKIKKIKESIKLILNSGVDFEFRTTVVPTLHTKESLVKLAKQLRRLCQRLKTKDQRPVWFLQQFVPQNCLDPEFEKVKPYSKEKMEEVLAAVQKYFSSAMLREV